MIHSPETCEDFPFQAMQTDQVNGMVDFFCQGSFLATFGARRLDGRLCIFVVSDPARICLDLHRESEETSEG